jgi:Tfp pilus assembly protein PilF
MLYPGDSNFAHGNLAAAYQVVGRTDEALTQFDIAVNIPPVSPIVLNGRGVVLAEKERFEESIESFKKAIMLDPLYISPRKNLAICYKKMGRDAEAVAEMQEAMRLE